MSFRDLLAYNVLHFPDKPVLKSRSTVYTWADIDHGASVIASELYALGVRKRTHAAICGTNSVNWILTFWAVQKLGAVAVLVNPALTAKEIIKLAHTGDIEYFCYGKMPAMSEPESFLAEIMSRSQIRGAFDIRDSVDFLGRNAVNAPETGEVMPDDVCVMIFTSGSTGSPKGVLHSAYSLCKIQGMCTKITHINENDIDCMMMPMFHIAGMMNTVIEAALFGALIILPKSIKPEYLLKLIHEENVLSSTPYLLCY